MVQPIIESSRNITFACHNYYYDELFDQMKEAKLSFWNNKWTNVFDFTPNREQPSKLNYKLDPSDWVGFVSSLRDIETIIS